MDSIASEKERVREFWNAEPCGTRYLDGKDDFDAHARSRYALEPYIFEFAAISEGTWPESAGNRRGHGLRLSGMAESWSAGCWRRSYQQHRSNKQDAAARLQATSPTCKSRTRSICSFPDDSFDVVYSYGVMHHSPDTPQCVREARRVLKPGGQARIMIYHHPSVTGAMLWLRYGLLRGKSLRRSVFDHLESPGTKTYTRREALGLFDGFSKVETRVEFSPGDLLLHQPSARFQSSIYRLVWKLFPRWLIRMLGRPCGLFLLVTATKNA